MEGREHGLSGRVEEEEAVEGDGDGYVVGYADVEVACCGTEEGGRAVGWVGGM